MNICATFSREYLRITNSHFVLLKKHYVNISKNERTFGFFKKLFSAVKIEWCIIPLETGKNARDQASELRVSWLKGSRWRCRKALRHATPSPKYEDINSRYEVDLQMATIKHPEIPISTSKYRDHDRTILNGPHTKEVPRSVIRTHPFFVLQRVSNNS